MNISEMAIEFIRNNPGCSSTQIADGAGIPRRMIQTLMSELFIQELVIRTALPKRPFSYRLPTAEDAHHLGARYTRHRKAAEKLETQKLWRRAAREWLSAMDATKDEGARDKAAARREYCIGCSDIGAGYDSPGIRVYSSPVADLWRD